MLNQRFNKLVHALLFLFGVLFGGVGFLVLHGEESLANRAFIPVYEECKDVLMAFYNDSRSYIDYQYFAFPRYVENARVIGVIEVKSDVVSEEYLNSFPSDKDAQCMPSSYATGTIGDSFDALFLDVTRAKEMGSTNVYVDIAGNDYIVRFRR